VTTITTTIRNWFGDLDQQPQAVVKAKSVDDIVAVMQDPSTYPGPVRAIGSNHSTTKCAVANGGTIVDMREMTEIIEIGDDYVTAQAGALLIDVAKELEKKGLQFYVNVELGNLTLGSGATGGTKDASMPGEFGQVCSYATSIKMVKADGSLVEITEHDGEVMQAARSSFGLMGIAYEVTFRVKKLQALRLRHEVYTLDEFLEALPALEKEGDSMMFYMFPFLDRIGVEFRRYQDGGNVKSHWQWKLRNWTWSKAAPAYARTVSRYVPSRRVKAAFYNGFARLMLLLLRVIKGKATGPADQIIRYPDTGGFTSYTFSIWAFPEDRYPEVIRGYYEFNKRYYDETGYRCDMLNVGYRILEDRSLLFSYTWDGTVMTLDPVSTGQKGWDEYLKAYNAYCSDAGGVPLFNQTKHITPDQAKKAFGDRLRRFEELRIGYDPTGRLLNPYFQERLT
jgi:FAD/FMN-containing dehydrogenase